MPYFLLSYRDLLLGHGGTGTLLKIEQHKNSCHVQFLSAFMVFSIIFLLSYTIDTLLFRNFFFAYVVTKLFTSMALIPLIEGVSSV